MGLSWCCPQKGVGGTGRGHAGYGIHIAASVSTASLCSEEPEPGPGGSHTVGPRGGHSQGERTARVPCWWRSRRHGCSAAPPVPGPARASWAGVDGAQRCGRPALKVCARVEEVRVHPSGKGKLPVLQANCQAGCAQEGLEVSWGEGPGQGARKGSSDGLAEGRIPVPAEGEEGIPGAEWVQATAE